MDEHDVELDRRVAERIEDLNASRAWPWQQPGAESAALGEGGRVTRYLAAETGLVVLGHIEP